MNVITPDWPAPAHVRALTTCRDGGVSDGFYASLNLGNHVGEKALSVQQNRDILFKQMQLPAKPLWLDQIHSTKVVEHNGGHVDMPIQADATIAKKEGLVCVVMTADCLPILLCNKGGTVVAALHAGWRGLLTGVVENTIDQLGEAEDLLAWCGPAIGPGRFEVGIDVEKAFVEKKSVMKQAFQQTDQTHFLADLYALARMTLLHCGVKNIFGGEYCTYNHANQFYSYRREPITGRMASLIWIQP
jgi:YfiH family protein